MLSRLRIALSFLTVLPVGGNLTFSDKALTSSAVFFPFVGWIIGSFLLAAGWAALFIGLKPLIGAVIMVGVSAIITRGLHLDGAADIFDGLGGSFDPSRRLAIMKDSYIGPFGVTGLVLLLLGKVAVLAMILEYSQRYLLAVMLAPVAARWAMVALAYKSTYPRPGGTGHPFVGKIKGQDLLFATIMVMPFFYFGWLGAVMLLAAQLPALWLRQKAHRAFGGVTGDVLGASCEFGELASWLGCAVYLGIIF